MTKIEAWAKIARTQLHPDHEWEAHLQAYEEVFQEKPTLPLLPLWYPEVFIDIQSVHLYEIYEELRSQNILPEASTTSSMYAVLHRWSVRERQDFWRYMITQRLQVPFDRAPDSWLTFPQGDISQPAWLLGARWNIIELILRQPEERLALIYERENGEVLTWNYGQLKREIQRIANA
ncbi:MAG: hypothetical protein NZ580_04450, partial [Bacteroidia bacterium]|nr:hypothetical protein [Bacteroidia bacterium]MDW8236176.1 hypothetical protein [Bacteroidia bacterium]